MTLMFFGVSVGLMGGVGVVCDAADAATAFTTVVVSDIVACVFFSFGYYCCWLLLPR